MEEFYQIADRKFGYKVSSDVEYYIYEEAAEEYANQFKEVWFDVTKVLPQEDQIIDASNGQNNVRCIYQSGKFYRYIDTSNSDRTLAVYYTGIKYWKPLTYPPLENNF